MREVHADIQWFPDYLEGRTKKLQPGLMYYPHISVDNNIESQSWSVCFLVTPISKDGNSTISFSLLVDNQETNSFFSKLNIGMDFKLLEGANVVAVGRINDIKQ